MLFSSTNSCCAVRIKHPQKLWNGVDPAPPRTESVHRNLTFFHRWLPLAVFHARALRIRGGDSLNLYGPIRGLGFAYCPMLSRTTYLCWTTFGQNADQYSFGGGKIWYWAIGLDMVFSYLEVFHARALRIRGWDSLNLWLYGPICRLGVCILPNVNQNHLFLLSFWTGCRSIFFLEGKIWYWAGVAHLRAGRLHIAQC